MTIFFAQIFLCELLRMQRNKFYAFLRTFLRNLCKPGSIANVIIFFSKFTKIESFSQDSAQNQTTDGLLKNLHTKKIMIMLLFSRKNIAQ